MGHLACSGKLERKRGRKSTWELHFAYYICYGSVRLSRGLIPVWQGKHQLWKLEGIEGGPASWIVLSFLMGTVDLLPSYCVFAQLNRSLPCPGIYHWSLSPLFLMPDPTSLDSEGIDFPITSSSPVSLVLPSLSLQHVESAWVDGTPAVIPLATCSLCVGLRGAWQLEFHWSTRAGPCHKELTVCRAETAQGNNSSTSQVVLYWKMQSYSNQG